MNKPLILVSNDDGYLAPGLQALIKSIRHLGDIVVVAPEEGQSGQSHAFTSKIPIYTHLRQQESGYKMYSCSGTPVDCVKLAIHKLLDRKPDIVVSGINHGANSSVSIIYSGTMAAAIEGQLNQVKSIGFSLDNYTYDADFSLSAKHAAIFVEKMLAENTPDTTCFNVNVPDITESELRGIRVCRHASGKWVEEFHHRKNPQGKDYYWLSGTFENFEQSAESTDIWALENNYISVVPVKVDFTHHEHITKFKDWNDEKKQ